MMKGYLVVFIIAIVFCANTHPIAHYKELYALVHSLTTKMKSTSEAVELAGVFEQTETADSLQWLTQYYASYCYVMGAFMEENPKHIDALALKSKLALDIAEPLAEDISEIYCLRSLIASARIMVDPESRGMKYGIESSTMLNKAKAANPNNPRVYLIEGQSLLYTPDEYGGGCKNALPLFDEALARYQAFNLKSEVHPNWGKDEVLQLIEQCRSE